MVWSRINLPKIKDGPFVINAGEYKSTGTHWIAFYVDSHHETYFHSSEVKHIREEVKRFRCNKNIKTNIYRMQTNDSIMYECICIGFLNFMLKGKILLDRLGY